MTAWCAEAQVESLVRNLAKPPPATISFTEVRFSALLRAPSIVSGELGFLSATDLDRRVTQPYREITEIRGDSVKVARDGEPVRSFALQRAPELQGLLAGFTAVLSGDPQALQRSFTAKVSGDEQAWTLELTPIDARLRRRLKQLRIDGRAAAPRCFAIFDAGNGASIMLLGAAANADLRGELTRERLAQKCRE
jgi:hypothetical protein